MTTEVEEQTEVDVKAGPIAFRAKSRFISEIVAIGSLTAALFFGYVLYQHDQQTAAAFKELSAHSTQAFREVSLTNRSIISEMRMQTCLQSIPEAERKAEYRSPFGWCKQVTQ